MKRRRVIIMGAGGRDFHNFNVYFRDNPEYEVVAFTATQIPFIERRRYPPELAGELYPEGIPIYPEEDLSRLIKEYDVDDVYFSYSDVSHVYVMNRAAIVNSAGASFHLLGFKDTMLTSNKPVVSVVAMRTGAGKSPVSRYVSKILRDKGLKVGIIRHPMAYGDFKIHRSMKLTSIEDLDKYQLTIEEKEDYEPHILNGFTVYSGIDYEEVLRMAEEESDIILWDGGNNDFPFIKSDVFITVVDPYRWRHIDTYYPGEINVRSADIIVISKINTAKEEDIDNAIKKSRELNKDAEIVKVGIDYRSDKEYNLDGKRVVVIEDGPTTTHGEMGFGAGYLYAKDRGAVIVDPRPYVKGTYKEIYNKYHHLKDIIPAVGYSPKQIKELEEILNGIDNVDYIISATPTRLDRYLQINKPIIHVYYDMVDYDQKLKAILLEKVDNIRK